MKPLFQTHLANGTRGHPALYIDFLFQRRALMFVLGEIAALRKRHRLSAAEARERLEALAGKAASRSQMTRH